MVAPSSISCALADIIICMGGPIGRRRVVNIVVTTARLVVWLVTNRAFARLIRNHFSRHVKTIRPGRGGRWIMVWLLGGRPAGRDWVESSGVHKWGAFCAQHGGLCWINLLHPDASFEQRKEITNQFSEVCMPEGKIDSVRFLTCLGGTGN
jgi:hypothetical protein